MEAKEIFEAESQSVRKLLSEPGVGFYIPPYQRPYSWDKDKVERLIEDVVHGFGRLIDHDESFTFLGTIITIHDRDNVTIQPIVRTDVPGRVLNVIDGQQRLTSLLVLCVGLHNQISLAYSKLLKPFKGTAPEYPDPVNWLDGQTLTVLQALRETFVQIQPHGTARKYPRMIRAFSDQWSRNIDLAKYYSPVACFIKAYSETIDNEKPEEFKPAIRDSVRIEGEEALIGRYQQVSKILKSIYSGRLSEDFDNFPLFADIAGSKVFQKALLNHEFPPEIIDYLSGESSTAEFQGLLRLVLFANYVLDRIALTVVKGKNEDYAFSVFESLNTTGEPLTAFETFRPRVVSAETLEKYENSKARCYIDQVVDYLAAFKAGEPLQAATRELLVVFASAETGEKLSKRLADQRKYLKDEYEVHEEDESERLAFVKHLRDTAVFVQHGWVGRDVHPSLHELPVAATSDIVKLCLAFLNDSGHSITVGVLVRFYSAALAAAPAEQAAKISDFENAIKAITAFSVLWRASRRGTANIDTEYRELLSGKNLTKLAPLARKADSQADHLPVTVQNLKSELRERLTSGEHGGIADKTDWVKQALVVPAYTNGTHIARFVLLAAYHDAVEAAEQPGLIMAGRADVSQCLTFDAWRAEKHLSLEHIAPREKSADWDQKFYEDKELIHRIGNLVLVQKEANSSLSNRPWKQKAILYSALGASSHHEAETILVNAEKEGVTFAQSTEELIGLSKQMPHLSAIGNYGFKYGKDWTTQMIETRSQRILELAWDRIWMWLQ
jgi:hypothetical protein